MSSRVICCSSEWLILVSTKMYLYQDRYERLFYFCWCLGFWTLCTSSESSSVSTEDQMVFSWYQATISHFFSTRRTLGFINVDSVFCWLLKCLHCWVSPIAILYMAHTSVLRVHRSYTRCTIRELTLMHRQRWQDRSSLVWLDYGAIVQGTNPSQYGWRRSKLILERTSTNVCTCIMPNWLNKYQQKYL